MLAEIDPTRLSCTGQGSQKEVKRIRVGRNTYEWKGNLDAELSIDALKNGDQFDTCILMSGDSDFAGRVL